MAINTVRTVERVVHLTRDHEAVAGVALCPPTAPRLVRESVPVRRPAAPWKPPMTGAMQGAIEALPMPGTYFALTLHEFASTDELRAALLEGTDIEELEPGADVSLGQQLRLNSNVSAREDSAWPLRLGRRYTPATHGALGFAAVSAPTLGEGLAVVERFAHVRMPLLRFHSRRDRSDQFSLVIGVRSDLPNSTCIPLSEMVMLSVQSLVAFMLGRRIVETSLQLAYPAPPHADRYADAFHGTARFGHPETSLTMPADWLDRQSPMADPLTYQTSLQQLEALHRRLESDDHIVVRVAQLIETHPTATLSFAEAAAHLHISERTLIRRLRRSGTSYSELLDAYRRKQAEALLRDPNFNMAEIGHRLGYSDVANFGRACRRWFGVSPRAFRLGATLPSTV